MSTVSESPTRRAATATVGTKRLPLGAVFAVTILISAFLLFQVQPLISKFILPWFGGSPAVWTTCMLFFQMLLFGGYAYAHISEHRLSRRMQFVVHLVLLAAALAFLPIAPSATWKPIGSGEPTWRILALLSVSVGLPYFVLSSTGPLVQAWFSRTYPGRSPYRLYSLSNFGSLIALLSYPFVFEPRFDVALQAEIWSWGFALFAAVSAVGLLGIRRVGIQEAPPSAKPVENLAAAADRVPWSRRLLWLALPAFASLMLLATTNHVCQDVAVIPFLWVVPLSLYLLTFIICFDHEQWYHRRAYAVGTALLVLLAAGLYELPWSVNYVGELVVYFAAMFGVCMLCHGELVRLKPPPQDLTSFYLMIAAGGALGGLFVSLAAPALFATFFEWKIGLFGGYLLAMALVLADLRPAWRKHPLLRTAPTAMASIAGLLAVPYLQLDRGREPLVEVRNFYGEAAVIERAVDDPTQHDRALLSGGIIHGVQFVAEEKQRWATTYYNEQSGVGRVLEIWKGRDGLRVGAVGLGVGTLATYARPGQTYRFYEINPEMQRLAETCFSYLRECRGDVEIVLGDARLSLEREPPQQYDVLVLDAFSGDSVPAHLLTREAFAIYERHIAQGGAICVHITNSYLDLAPVVRGVAGRFGWEIARVKSESDSDRALYSADWMVLTRNRELLAALGGSETDAVTSRSLLWTDAYSNLFQILK